MFWRTPIQLKKSIPIGILESFNWKHLGMVMKPLRPDYWWLIHLEGRNKESKMKKKQRQRRRKKSKGNEEKNGQCNNTWHLQAIQEKADTCNDTWSNQQRWKFDAEMPKKLINWTHVNSWNMNITFSMYISFIRFTIDNLCNKNGCWRYIPEIWVNFRSTLWFIRF